MSKFKVGDRVKLNKDRNGLKVGSIGTIMEIGFDDDISAVFINSDKLNLYNHSRFNGNGVIMDVTWLKLIYKKGKWSTQDVDYLHSFYRRKSVTEMAKHLKRSYASVQSKASSEGIHKHPRREYTAEDNYSIIHFSVDKIPADEIGSKLNRGKSSIGGRLSLMNSRRMIPVFPTGGNK